MRKSHSRALLEKSIGAMVAAIEVYNKPDHRYREETFAILALNAWELLLKAKILLDANNRDSSLYERRTRPRKDGSQSKKLYVARNRAGNPATIGLTRALGVLQSRGALPNPVRLNIEALTEVRDNAVHYINRGPGLSQQVQEYGTASLQNFVSLVRAWFNENMSRYDFFLMPLAFFRDFRSVSVAHLTNAEKKLAQYLNDIVAAPNCNDLEHSVRLVVDIELRRTTVKDAPEVRITNDPTAPALFMTEEDIHRNYPWDYKELCARLHARYADFVTNQCFHNIRKPLVGDPRFSKRRLLDPANPTGTKKDFYSPNILQVFDQYYARRS